MNLKEAEQKYGAKLIQKLIMGELRAEGREIVHNFMSEAEEIHSEFEHINRQLWINYDINIENNTLSSNHFSDYNSGTHEQITYSDIRIFDANEQATVSEKNKGGRPPLIDQERFNAEIAAYFYLVGDTDPIKDAKKFRKDIVAKVPYIYELATGEPFFKDKIQNNKDQLISVSDKTLSRAFDNFEEFFKVAYRDIEKADP